MTRKPHGTDNGDGDPIDATLADRAFDLKRRHERRILSWSPDPDEEAQTTAVVEAPERPARERPVEPARPADDGDRVAPAPAPAPAPAAPTARADGGKAAADEPAEGEQPSPRRRGRPKGRAQRRQVHFHVNPEEDRLLLAAAARYGSQQKGLVAALRSLQEAELLRDEIRRLQAEFERQQRLLEEAEALFKR